MIKPLNDRIVVKRIEEIVSEGIIAIPDIAKETSNFGEIVAIGPGKLSKKGTRIPLDAKIGQIVMFGRFTDFDRDGLVMIQEGDIVGVVENA